MVSHGVSLASFPGPRPASHHLQYGKVGEGLVHFLTWVTSWTGQIMRTWVSCKPQKTWPALHALEHDYSESKDGSRRFTRQLGGERVLPSQDSKDALQQFSCAHPRSIKVFLPSFYPWRHSCEVMYQALSSFTVLQATGSWAWARDKDKLQ